MAQLEERQSGSNLNPVNEAAKLKAGSVCSSQSGRVGHSRWVRLAADGRETRAFTSVGSELRDIQRVWNYPLNNHSQSVNPSHFGASHI